MKCKWKTGMASIIAAVMVSFALASPLHANGAGAEILLAWFGKKKKETTDTPAPSVQIKVPEKKNNSFFYEISDDVMADVMTASPASLQRASAKLRKASIDYTEQDKIILSVAASIMKIAWPTESVTWNAPPPLSTNAYTGAVESAKKGVYDSSTGNTDFLTLVLPSLVLLVNQTRTDYYSEAENALNSALKIKGDSVLAAYLLGVLYKREGKAEESLEMLKKAVSFDSECFQTSFALALALMESGKQRDALSITEKFAPKYPGDMELLKLCAKVNFALENYSAAEMYVARVLQQNPSDMEYILFRARILVEMGDYIKATALLDVYSRTETSSKDYLLLRARVQRDWNKNLRGAVETMTQAVMMYPGDEAVLLFAAEIASVSNDRINGMGAGELVASVLKKDSFNLEALSISVKALISEKRWDEAYKASSQLLKDENAAKDCVYNHITVCIALGKIDEAWKLVKDLYGASPSDERTIQAYLEVLYAAGRKRESSDFIEKLLPSSSSKLKSFLYYRRSFLSDNEQTILSDLRSSLMANSRNSDALYRLYTIYFNKKDYRKAQYYLKQVVALNPTNKEYLKKSEELEDLF